MRDIGVGLVGYGLGGRAFHAPYVLTTPGMRLRAVVSRDPGKVLRDLPAVRVVPSVTVLLADPEIDLVIVSSPDELHAEHAGAAIAAGRHVLVDKPFATTLDDARRLADAAAASGRVLTAFHNRRWDADFLTLRLILDEGLLGRVAQMESRFDRWRPLPAPGWKEARRAGSWLDLGPHLVDQAVCLFGMPDAIFLDLATLRDDAPAPDHFHALLRYPGLRVVLRSGKLVADHALRFAVHGTGGSWIKHGVDPQEAAAVAGLAPGGESWGLDPDDGAYTPADLAAPARGVPNVRGDYRSFWIALAAAVRGEGPNPVPPGEALAVMRVLDAGLRSAAERREIAIEPDE